MGVCPRNLIDIGECKVVLIDASDANFESHSYNESCHQKSGASYGEQNHI